MTLEVVRTVADLRARVKAWRLEDLSVGLVPTMGGLHEGHLSLVRLALEKTDRAVVTIFVNPKQFGAGEDFDVYPRDLETDAQLLGGLGAHLLFAPSVAEVYAEDHAACVSVPGVGDILEGACRPGFFAGVATVVAKLLLQTLPDIAFFGEKDYQQLLVIRRMVKDLNIPVDIDSGPTLRCADGLALSSRNAYLSAEESAIAPVLHEVLAGIAENPSPGTAQGVDRLLKAGFSSVDYLEVRDAETLEPWTGAPRPARVLAAAWLGETRLIDNVAVKKAVSRQRSAS